MANTQYPKSLYRVFECTDSADCWSFDPSRILLEDTSLGEAHWFAYQLWLKDRSKAYTIIQPYDDSCRGGYGAWADAADAEND